MKIKFLFFLLAFYPTIAHSIALTAYYDKNGQIHLVSSKANTNRQPTFVDDGQPVSSSSQIHCLAIPGDPETYWNGQACVPIPIVESCKKQGGAWVEVQLRVPQTGVEQCSFVNMCACPNNLTWDARNCRSDVPLNKQVERQVNLGPKVKMTTAFFDHIGEYINCH